MEKTTKEKYNEVISLYPI